MAENGIATAEDFKKLAEEGAFEPPERVVLPKCGFGIIMRRPRPVAFALYGGTLPTSLARTTPCSPPYQGGEQGVVERYTREEIVAIAKFWTEMLTRAIVQPKLSLTPGPDEIHPNWIPPEDQAFIIRWMVGEVEGIEPSGRRTIGSSVQSPDGQIARSPDDSRGLARFPGEYRSIATPGAGGGDVALPSQRFAEGDNDGVAD
jgi:hypothetical protein